MCHPGNILAVLGHPGGSFRLAWDRLGQSSGHLGSIWDVFLAILTHLGPSWTIFGPSCTILHPVEGSVRRAWFSFLSFFAVWADAGHPQSIMQGWGPPLFRDNCTPNQLSGGGDPPFPGQFHIYKKYMYMGEWISPHPCIFERFLKIVFLVGETLSSTLTTMPWLQFPIGF